MKFNKLVFAFTLLSAVSVMAVQELESEVVAEKFNSSSSVVIDKKEIEKSHAKNVTTLLATQANLSVSQTNFQPYSIYLRGGDSSHVLILLDGVPVYDVTSIQRTFNLNSIDIKSIQRIEIIKGSQSVYFGGQALSGVIKIDTIPAELKSSTHLMAGAGSQSTQQTSAGFARPLDEQSMVTARGSLNTKQNGSPIEGSSKKYPTSLGTGEVSYVYKNADIDSFLKAMTSFEKTEIATTDYPAYTPKDTDNFYSTIYFAGATGLVNLKNAPLKPTLSVGYQKTNRMYEQDAVSAQGAGATKWDYVGNLISVRLDTLPVDTDVVKVRAGVNYSGEDLTYKNADVLISQEQTNYEGAFVKADIKPVQFLLFEVGTRIDYERAKDSNQTYHLGLTFFDDLKLEYSTGFKRPSLSQLYGAYASPGLQPEKSKSASLEYQHSLTADTFASVTFFHNEFSNLILYRSTPSPAHYENVSKSRTVGIEGLVGVRFPESQITTTLTLGYQEPKDIDADTWLPRRPLRTASFKMRKEFEKLGWGFEAVHNGDRRDLSSATTSATLPSYTYFNSTLDYALKDDTSLFLRGQNLTNQKYESTYGFHDEGLSFLAGFELTL